MRLPDFIHIGPTRTGTNWLHTVLEGHVGLPRVRQTHFFERHYDKGIEWYAEYFRHVRSDQPVGEICPYYHLPQAREMIARYLPHCKLICTFRDPVDRGYSMYKMMRHYGAVQNISFETAVSTVAQISDSNRYAYHLREWQSRFGADRVLVTFYDDLRNDSQGYLDRICDFIEIPRVSLEGLTISERAEHSFERAPKNRRLAGKARRLLERLEEHRRYAAISLLEQVGFWDYCFGRGEKFAPLDPELKARLRESLLPEIEDLERMTGRDLSAWKGRRTAAQPGANRDNPSTQSLLASGQSSR